MRKAILMGVLLALSASGWAVSVNSLAIEVSVDSAGNAGITENYELAFISPFEENEFSQKAIENSSSIFAWQADYPFFFPHFAEGIDELSQSTIAFDRNAKKITFSYSLKERFATLVEQEQRSDFFVIDDRQLGAFNESGTIVIPENTTIRIVVPQNSEIDVSQIPNNASVAGNSVTLSGIQSNSIAISYRVIKPIAPPGNLLEGISGIYLLLGPIVVLIVAGVYLKRKDIERLVENYLVEHSEIKKTSREEDFDLEFD